MDKKQLAFCSFFANFSQTILLPLIVALHAMKVSELQNIFIDELKALLSDWKFIKSQRHFKKNEEGIVWLLHIGCLNHLADFDAVGDVAVEFKAGKESICIVGAELGNIEGTGQNRFSVSTSAEARSSATKLYKYFEDHGLPFLRKYSNPVEVVTTLEKGGKEAMLISPFLNQHQEQMNRLSSHYDISM